MFWRNFNTNSFLIPCASKIEAIKSSLNEIYE